MKIYAVEVDETFADGNGVITRVVSYHRLRKNAKKVCERIEYRYEWIKSHEISDEGMTDALHGFVVDYHVFPRDFIPNSARIRVIEVQE